MDNNTKIFGIGLNKTGTSTLREVAKTLGLKTNQPLGRELLVDIKLNNDWSNVHKAVEQGQLFQDWPWPLIYRKMDQAYPGSKFILTTRKNPQVWLGSLKKHAMRTDPNPKLNCRTLAYGYEYPHNHEQEHIDIYNRHNQEVRQYFAGREQDFIEICWENGDSYDKLCGFLGIASPGGDIPHVNQGSTRRVGGRKYWLNILKSKFK